MTSPLGRYASEAHDELVTVVLLDAPLRVWQRATEHHDDLMREMALLALDPATPGRDLPHRLLELIDVMGRQYGAATARPDTERDAALAAGLDRVDLRYEVPRSAGQAAQHLRDLLDEIEEFCRAEMLLTLAQPPVEAAFARWYVEQFTVQTQGGEPVPWPGPWD
ncbi:MAG: hypothetical protein WCD35_15160 [Mycobacteriales bacterium]